MDDRLEKLLLEIREANKSMNISNLDLFKELIGLYDRIYKIRLRNEKLRIFTNFKDQRLGARTILKLIEISRSFYLELKDRELNLKPLRGELIRLGRIKKEAESFLRRKEGPRPCPLGIGFALLPYYDTTVLKLRKKKR